MLKKMTLIAAGGLVVNANKELLLIFRRGKWDLPKGKMEETETIEDCAIREVKEETGLQQVEIKQFVGTTTHDYFDNWLKQDVTKISHWYLMETHSTSQLVPQKNEDIEEAKWVRTNELGKYIEDTYPNIIQILKEAELIK
ncbi:MAG: NUDIX domain-containing protein [Hydrotalea sp.]|nr:NUDIX domain-containing protein [Hydrotalea sp.]